ncbi:hypothetical protein M422DRAFT_242181 [Sphaerobolus stellatus SS14]|nr:hypothetical protein M422DRAFT_242181 [Sphaerobolus stellatus SS14]
MGGIPGQPSPSTIDPNFKPVPSTMDGATSLSAFQVADFTSSAAMADGNGLMKEDVASPKGVDNKMENASKESIPSIHVADEHLVVWIIVMLQCFISTLSTLQKLVQVMSNLQDAMTESNAALQPWDGPGSSVLWTQSLAYPSLGLSLLAGFGAVLGKQWLGHFKTSRFGHGTRAERGVRRYQKMKGIDEWYLRPILDALPFMLQLSLLLFGISLAINLFSVEKILGGIIGALVLLGMMFYACTFMLALAYPDSPFQLGLTSSIRSFLIFALEMILRYFIWFRTRVRIPEGSSSHPSISPTQTGFKPTLTAYKLDLPQAPLSNDVVFTSDLPQASFGTTHFQTGLCVLETSSDNDALLTTIHFLTNYSNWEMDKEAARRAFCILQKFLENNASEIIL